MGSLGILIFTVGSIDNFLLMILIYLETLSKLFLNLLNYIKKIFELLPIAIMPTTHCN